MKEHRHAFMIRAPERVVASYARKNELHSAESLGYEKLHAWHRAETERTGLPPPVIDTDDVLANPAGVLKALCAALDIAWDPAMLNWKPGPHPEDGIWGAHWYDRVNASTGFAPPPGPLPVLTGAHADVAAACRADYDALKRQALSA